MAKYNTYIELSPHYESVVDIDSESRHPDMWQEYIVHEDMKGAIEKICDSMKYEDEDKRRSFWIHGAYGTGNGGCHPRKTQGEIWRIRLLREKVSGCCCTGRCQRFLHQLGRAFHEPDVCSV